MGFTDDNYRPVIKGFLQCQHSLMQLVLKKNGQKCQVKNHLGDNEYRPGEKPTKPLQINIDPLSYRATKNGVNRRQLQTSDQRFRSVSALISTASPGKNE